MALKLRGVLEVTTVFFLIKNLAEKFILIAYFK